MKHRFPLLLIGFALLVPAAFSGDGAEARAQASAFGYPVGKWRIEFTNGVTEICNIGNGGEALVDEPGRSAMGVVEAQGSNLVLSFVDDRLERWSPVAGRFVVEHWASGLKLPVVTPVLGIAERMP